VAGGAHPGGESLAADALDRLLACFIDAEDKDLVGQIESVGELVHQRRGPCVAVRLEDYHQAAGLQQPQGLQCRFDLSRVVAVVVDHVDAACRTTPFHPTARPAKL